MMSSSAYIRAIRGPVLLVVLGTLMLLDQQSGISFWNTWPLLLVAGGLMVLAERTAVRENPWTAPGMGNGGGSSSSGFPPPPPPPPPTSVYRKFGEAEDPLQHGKRDDEQQGGPHV